MSYVLYVHIKSLHYCGIQIYVWKNYNLVKRFNITSHSFQKVKRIQIDSWIWCLMNWCLFFLLSLPYRFPKGSGQVSLLKNGHCLSIKYFLLKNQISWKKFLVDYSSDRGNTVDQHQHTALHPEFSLTVETSHRTTSGNLDSVPLQTLFQM